MSPPPKPSAPPALSAVTAHAKEAQELRTKIATLNLKLQLAHKQVDAQSKLFEERAIDLKRLQEDKDDLLKELSKLDRDRSRLEEMASNAAKRTSEAIAGALKAERERAAAQQETALAHMVLRYVVSALDGALPVSSAKAKADLLLNPKGKPSDGLRMHERMVEALVLASKALDAFRTALPLSEGKARTKAFEALSAVKIALEEVKAFVAPPSGEG